MKAIVRFATRIPKIDWWTSRLGIIVWTVTASLATVLWFVLLGGGFLGDLNLWLRQRLGNDAGAWLDLTIMLGPPLVMVGFGTVIGLVRLQRINRKPRDLAIFAVSTFALAVLTAIGFMASIYGILLVLIPLISGIRALALLVRPNSPEEHFSWNPASKVVQSMPFSAWWTSGFGVLVWSALVGAVTFFWGSLTINAPNTPGNIFDSWLHWLTGPTAGDWLHFFLFFSGFCVILFMGCVFWNLRLTYIGGSKGALHVFAWIYGILSLFFSLPNWGYLMLMLLPYTALAPAISLLALMVQLLQPAQKAEAGTGAISSDSQTSS